MARDLLEFPGKTHIPDGEDSPSGTIFRGKQVDEYAVYTSYVKTQASRLARESWESHKTDSLYGWYDIARNVFDMWRLDCLEKSNGWDIHWTAGNIVVLRQVFIDAYVAEIALIVGDAE